MKKLKIRIVSERPEGVTAAQWVELKKLPVQEVNAVTAIENVRNSNGLYEVVPESKTGEAPEMPTFAPETMSRGQLVAAAMQFGVTLSKKNIQTEDLRKLVVKKYDDFMEAVAEPPVE